MEVRWRKYETLSDKGWETPPGLYGPASGQGANDAKLKENVLRACCSSCWCCVGDAVVVECGGSLGRVTESDGCSWRVVWRLG